MHLLYSIALSLLFLALLPYFLYQAIRHGKYAGSLRERLGSLPDALRSDGRPTIWLHAVSVGEFIAARPLVSALKREMPDHRIIVSTTTLTGRRLADASAREDVDGVFYFPFDWSFAVRRTLNHVRPAIVVIIETELWPNFLRECHVRGVTTVVAGGRLSQRSFSRYLIARRFMSRLMANISLMVMQSEADAERARALGARSERVRVCGNLKYDITSRSTRPTTGSQEIDRWLRLCRFGNLIVAGSTSPGEEETVLKAFRMTRETPGLEETRLLIAPRHPERFDEVERLLQQSGFRFVRRSRACASDARSSSVDNECKSPDQRLVDVILLDSIGELAAVYGHASIVFVGGSLVPRGGHNIIEPAAHAKPIVIGPHMDNFRQVVSDFSASNALVQIGGNSPSLLAAEFVRLLSDPVEASALGERASSILERSRGATECTVRAIKEVLSG